MKTKAKLKNLITKLINLLFYGCLVAIVFILLQVFCFASFRIPTDSMEPILEAGDNLIVNKLTQGARLFDVYAAMGNEDFTIRRTPGFRKLKHNDVIVFNFPYPVTCDSISFNIMSYYVKRCIALPGDTLSICNGFYKVSGTDKPLGNIDSQQSVSTLLDAEIDASILYTYPWNEHLNWTIKNFGPLPVPSKGQVVQMDSTTSLLYYRLISWEQKKKLHAQGNTVFLGDSIIERYQFNENYYFVGGDKLENSQDSRYWGLLPENYIVGKASFIWKSRDPVTNKVRWNRVFKKIK